MMPVAFLINAWTDELDARGHWVKQSYATLAETRDEAFERAKRTLTSSWRIEVPGASVVVARLRPGELRRLS